MWSRRFLITGLLTGVLAAAIALLVLGLGIGAASAPFGGGPWAGFVAFGIFGIVIYPACWAITIHRARDYSVRRTLYLVAISYGVCCLVVLAVLFVGFAYQAATITLAAAARPVDRGITMWFALTPVIVVIYGLIGAAALAIPYAALATPVALLHRQMLLRMFASAPGASGAVPLSATQ